MTWRALSISPYRGVSAIEAEPVVYAVMSVGGRVGEDEDVRAVFAGGGKWRPYHLVPLGQGGGRAASAGRGGVARGGRAVQVDPIKPTLTAPGSKRLKLKFDEPLSNFAFKFNMRCYTAGGDDNLGAGAWSRAGVYSSRV